MVSLAKSWNTGNEVFSVAVSPDGARVGAACENDVQLWDLHSGERVLGPLKGHSSFVNSVAYSLDGRAIASGSSDKTIRVWDTATGAVEIGPLKGHRAIIGSVTFSYDGRLIISGSFDETIRLWDVRTGRSAGTPIEVGAHVCSVAVSPDGSKIVGGGYGGTIKTYDAATMTMLCKHTGHIQRVNSVAFSPDSRRIVSGSGDKTVRIWDASTGSSIGDPLEGHNDSVASVSYSPDGRYIASSSDDYTIRIWDVAAGAQTRCLRGHIGLVKAVAFTPDGSTLVSGASDKTIELWDITALGIQGGENVRSLDPVPSLFDEIASTTTPQQIILHLRTRGCADFTDLVDLTTCSPYPISSGGFGDIYRCKLKNNMEVAIKTVRLYVDSSEKSQKHMKHTARELYTWSMCRHPNVQQLLGLVMFRDQIGMVAAWQSNGDMPGYLQRSPSTDRCRMSIQIVEGLSYLHVSGVVHGDLKGANVLISEDGSARLADFGNAALQELSLRFTSTSTRPGLSPRWAAPELFKDTKCNVPADIYALGMTILETLTGDVPFPDKQDRQVMFGVMFERLQPTRPEAYIPTGSKDGNKMWSLLQWCWQYKPEKRPSAAEVQKTIKQITRAGLNTEATAQGSSWVARILTHGRRNRFS